MVFGLDASPKIKDLMTPMHLGNGNACTFDSKAYTSFIKTKRSMAHTPHHVDLSPADKTS